jgi:hypothetical protein
VLVLVLGLLRYDRQGKGRITFLSLSSWSRLLPSSIFHAVFSQSQNLALIDWTVRCPLLDLSAVYEYV